MLAVMHHCHQIAFNGAQICRAQSSSKVGAKLTPRHLAVVVGPSILCPAWAVLPMAMRRLRGTVRLGEPRGVRRPDVVSRIARSPLGEEARTDADLRCGGRVEACLVRSCCLWRMSCISAAILSRSRSMTATGKISLSSQSYKRAISNSKSTSWTLSSLSLELALHVSSSRLSLIASDERLMTGARACLTARIVIHILVGFDNVNNEMTLQPTGELRPLCITDSIMA